ncbi:MAG: serine/threonine-protein kinase [Acidobacteriota bacterium]
MGHRLTSETDDTIPAQDADASAASPQAQDGARYRLGAELGRGGMGRVVEAFDAQLQRVVALKEVLPKAGPGADKRFAREVQITARLEHQSIVPLYDAGTLPDGRPYYVMRKVSGKPLDQLIARGKGLPDRLALLPNLLSAIDAVAHAHRRGVIHRDLKPANILVGELGETVVIDWGLAKVIGEDDHDGAAREPHRPSGDSLHTQLGSVFGTPGFMPPEQARGDELGPRSDVFALGATLYTLLVGKPPVAGTSATEVLEATHKHQIVPVAEACPGAPPELVAIVDHALAAEPAARYAHAGALGEDVRRFLTGQLVAAHHYTRVERLLRFARRHRSVLSVSALALALVAVLGWVGVHRIVRARDAASAAEARARSEKREVDAANTRLEDNVDQLRVWRAQALLADNPTQAIAVLKQVRPAFARVADARAMAQAAVARGVAWQLDTGPAVVAYSELSQDATKLAQTTITGELRVLDLEGRRELWHRALGRAAHGTFVHGGKQLLVTGLASPAQLVDAQTGAPAPGALPVMRWAALDERGERAVYYDDSHAPAILELATRQTRALPLSHADELAIAPDGGWIAVGDGKQLVVFDATGKELARRAGRVQIVVGRARRVAVLGDDKVAELVLDPAPAWTELAVPLEPKFHVMQLSYRNDELTVTTSSAAFLVRAGNTFARRPLPSSLVWGVTPVRDVLVALGEDGKLHYTSGLADGAITLPATLANARVIGRAGQARFAVTGQGAVLVFDADAFLPHRIAAHRPGEVAFVDDDLLLLYDQRPDWAWYDLAAGQLVRPDVPEWGWGAAFLLDIDGPERRVLKTVEVQRDASSHLAVMRPGKPDREISVVPSQFFHTMQVRPRIAALVPGDAVVFGDGARVMAAIGDASPRELAKIDGGVVAVTRLGRLRFAALSARGELVRGSVATGDVERVRVPDVEGYAILAGDRDGRVLVGAGPVLRAWSTRVDELARFDQPIEAIAAVDGGIAVTLADHGVVLVAPGGAKTRLLAPSSQAPVASGDGRLVVGTGNGGQLELVELPAAAHWTLPWLYGAAYEGLAVAPATRRVVQASGDQLAVWKLPEASTDLAGWLAGLTNACMVQDHLEWPQDGHCAP